MKYNSKGKAYHIRTHRVKQLSSLHKKHSTMYIEKQREREREREREIETVYRERQRHRGERDRDRDTKEREFTLQISLRTTRL